MIERRKEERTDANMAAVFSLDGAGRSCTVLNMSGSGLLLRFDAQSDLLLSTSDVGRIGTVVLGTGEEPQKKLRGRIVRLLPGEDFHVVALSMEQAV